MLRLISLQCIAAALGIGTLNAQQVADTVFQPPIGAPSFAMGQGPVVLIDEAHHNFHTAEGRYSPFARLLRRDGYVVRPGRSAQGLAAAHTADDCNHDNRTNSRSP